MGILTREKPRKKISKNVLKKGDRCYRSGDLIRREEDGYIYFVDVLGNQHVSVER